MDAVLQRTEGPADAELISAVRGGDADAFGELFDRHVDAARRLARQLVPPADADDLVSEAFAKVFSLLQRGSGPDLAFRAYLLTAIRRLHVDRIRSNARLQPTDNLEPFDPGVPFRDTAVEGFENAAAAKAFTSLPERWQAVLWHTEVEDQKPAEVAVLLGMSANSVSALAYRAREGLRQAFLTMHLQELEDDACAWTHQNLGAYVRNGISRRDASKVENHLSECRRCTALYLELTEVNSNLSGLLAPLLLGGVAAAYVGTGAGVSGLAALKGGLLVLLDRAKDFVAAHAPASAAAGVAAAAVVAGGVFVITDDDPRPAEPPTAGGQDRAGRGAQNPVKQGRDRQDRPERRRSNASGGPGVSRSSSSSEPATLAPAPAPPTGPDAEPGGDSGPDSTGGPGPQPGPSDTPPNEQQPNEQPPNDPQSRADLRVTATASSQEGAVYRVTVEVSGLAPGGAATLSVAGRGVTVVLTHDGRCDSPHPQTCRVTSTPTTFEFTAVAAPGSDASVVFTVSPDDGTADADRSNNRATVPLGA